MYKNQGRQAKKNYSSKKFNQKSPHLSSRPDPRFIPPSLLWYKSYKKKKK